MYYANSFLNQLLPNKAKKVRYAPPANASQISGGISHIRILLPLYYL